MKKEVASAVVLLCLGGCSQALGDDLSTIDRVHIISDGDGEEAQCVVIDEQSSVDELMDILNSAQVGSLLRDDEISLEPAVYYELYQDDELVHILMFNGEDTSRVFHGGLCFEVEYPEKTLSEWYSQLQ